MRHLLTVTTSFARVWFLVRADPIAGVGGSGEDWQAQRASTDGPGLGLGVKTFGKMYCGKYRRGVRPVHVSTGSRGLIRHILHQLEKMKLVEIHSAGKGGRCLTSQGRRDLDLIAGRVSAASNADTL
eukprot:scaffold1758_cov333-Pavlova_lutheri.AAC.25